MAKKITDLPSLANADSTDILPIVDVSANVTKQVTVEGLVAGIPDDAITTGMLDDGSVTAAKLANDAGFVELGRTTLGTAGDTMSVTSLPARKYLQIVVAAQDTGGTIAASIRFNNDTGSNYTRRYSVNNAADTTGVATSSILLTTAAAQPIYSRVDVVNIAAQEKLVIGQAVVRNTAGTGSNPDKFELSGKWVNTSDQITRIDIINSGAGDFAIGSEVIVYGHN